MATNQAIRKNQSALQVLKTLKVLLEGDYTLLELEEKLNEKENEPIFNDYVIRKYINTCRYCGIKIEKINNKYFVKNLSFGINFNETDNNIIEDLDTYTKNNFPSKFYEKFHKIITKICKYSNANLKSETENTSRKIIEEFEKAIENQRKIELTLDARTVIICIPLEVIHHRGRAFFNIINEEGEKLICTNKIIALNILQDRATIKKEEVTVIFKLRGNLSKRYTPREHESVEIGIEPNTILVTNKGENKEILFARLLRYDSCCEILSPKSYRNEMKDLLKNMLSNYGV